MTPALKNLLFLLFFFPACLFAFPSDPQQAVHITADSSTFDFKTSDNIYKGNVIITQGTTRLTADRVMTHTNKQKIVEATAYGISKPVEYSTLPKPNDAVFYAKAKKIRFYPIKSIVILEGDVIVTQGKNSFQGPILIYNIKDQTVSAPASQTGRATMIIESDKLKL